MISLNLLPPREKEIIIFEKLRHYFLSCGGMLFFVSFTFIVLLFSAYMFLSITLKAQNDLIKITKETPESQKLEKIEKDIKEINGKINQIYSIQKDFVLWSKVMDNLISSAPEDIYLKSFSGKKQNSQIIISGFAPTREHLVDFEQSLKKSEKFSDVYSPISNLLKKTEIDFNLTFKFTK